MQLPFVRRFASAVTITSLFLASQPVAAQTTLPARTAQDVGQSFHLLENTAYRSVDAQHLLDAARAALVAYAHDRGQTITVPALTASGDETSTVTELDDAIATAAAGAHGDPTAYAYAAIDGMASAFGDRYTQFFTPDEFRQFTQALDPQRISGIGVLVEVDPATTFIRLSYVLPGTPADHAGLQSGDLLVAIDGHSTKGFSLDDARKLLRGKAGSTVVLSVESSVQSAPRLVSMKRSEVDPPTVIFKMLPNQIGYVWVLDFGRRTPAEFETAMQRLQQQGARGLVLDLRNDGGGYVDSALDISSHFLGDQAILTVEERDNRSTTIDADDQEAQINLPTTVLVNADTASASEITAGALQDNGAATLIGTRTFGKGVMQTLTELPDGAAIKITTAHYLTPRHRDINLRGIDPDVSVTESRDARFGDLTTDAQLQAAVDLLQRKIAAVVK